MSLETVKQVEAYCQLVMNAYDSLPPSLRKIVQEDDQLQAIWDAYNDLGERETLRQYKAHKKRLAAEAKANDDT